MTPVDDGPMPPMTLDDFLCFAVYSTGLAFNRVYKPLLDRYGLTYSQYLLLIALSAKDAQTVGELGEKLFLESNTLTPLIKRLEAAEIVSRKRDAKDERVVRVSLTAKGRTIIEEAAQCVPREVGAASDMTLDDMVRLKGQIATLRDQLLGAAQGGDVKG